jgi:starch phosphorylase
MTVLNYGLLPRGVEGIDSLAELTLDLNWSWNHRTDEVWRLLDPTLFYFNFENCV